MTDEWPALPEPAAGRDQPREPNTALYVALGVVASLVVGIVIAVSGVVSIGATEEVAAGDVAEATTEAGTTTQGQADPPVEDEAENVAEAAPAAAPDPTATPRPQPTSTPWPRPTATPRPQPTATPRPQPTAVPAPTPTVPPRYAADWLRPDGIGQVDFGASKADALAWANSVFGPPNLNISYVCRGTYNGQSYTTLEYAIWSEIPYLTSISFHNGSLIGWNYTGQNVPSLTTPTGLRLGSSQADVQRLYAGANITVQNWSTPSGVPLADRVFRHDSGASHISGYLLNGVVGRMWAGAECEPSTG